MRKYISLVIVIIFLMIPVTTFAKEKTIQFSFDDAIKIATENSKQAKLDDFTIRTKEKALKKIREDNYAGGFSDSKESILAYEIRLKTIPQKAESDVENAKRVKQENLYKLRLEVLKAASNIKMDKREIEKERKKLENLKERYKILLAKNKAGDITSDEVIKMASDINSKENENKDLEQKLTNSYISFKKLLNLPLDETVIEITQETSYSKFEIGDLNFFISKAQESSLDIYIYQEKFDLEEDIMALTAKYFQPGEYEYDNENLNLENAKADLADSKMAVEVDVKNKYNQLLNTKDKIAIAESYLALVDSRLKNAELRYKKGYLSKEALLDNKDSYIEALFQKDFAVNNYNIAVAELKNLVKSN